MNDQPAPRRSVAGRLLGLFGWGLVGLALLLGGAAFLASRTVTLQWAAQQAVDLSGGRLRIEGIAGSVLEEISADSVRWLDDGVDVTVTSLRLAYQPLALLDGFARITRASAANIEVTLLAAAGQPRQPIRLGPVLDPLLPYAIERLEVGRLMIREAGGRPLELRDIEVVLAHDGDRINAGLMNAQLVAGESRVIIRGDAALLSRAPYATDGRFVIQLPLPGLQPQPLRLDLRLNGPLEELAVRASTVFAGAPVQARGVVYAFEPRPLRQVRLDVKDFDLSRYDRSLPVTRLTAGLDLEVMPVWASGRRPWLIGPVTLANTAAGTFDRRRLPLAAAKAVVAILDGRLEVHGLRANGPMGDLAGDGWFEPADFRLALNSDRLRLQGIDSGFAPRTVQARLTLEPLEPATRAAAGVRLKLDASDDRLAADMTADYARGQVQIRQAQVRSLTGRGHARFDGTVGSAPSWPLDLRGDFRDFDPSRLVAMPPALLNGTWQARGPAAGPGGGAVATTIRLQDSRFRELALAGTLGATVSLAQGRPQRLTAVAANLQWGEASLEAGGSLGVASDQLRLKLATPRAGQLDPCLAGGLQADVLLSGPLLDPAVKARVDAGRLTVVAGGLRARTAAASLELTMQRSGGADLDLRASLTDVELEPAADAASPPAIGAAPAPATATASASEIGSAAAPARVVRLGRVTAALGGAYADHTVALEAVGKDRRLQASARGSLGPDGVWRGSVLDLSAVHPLLGMTSDAGAPADSGESVAPLRSLAPFALQVGGGRASVRDGRFRFPGARLVVRQFDWDDSFVTLKADASGIATRWLAALVDGPELDARPPGAPDLLLGAAIDFQGNLADATAADWRGTVQLQRESGDLWVSGAQGQAPISAGLRTLGASASLSGRVASLIVNVAGDSVGRIALDARTTLQSRGAPMWARSSLSHSPLAGRLDVAMNSFRWIAPLQGDRWRVDGALDAQLKLAGTLTRPHADGIVTGSNLSAHEPTLGMHLRNGVLAAEFAGDRVDVRMLRFEGGEGGGNVAISGLLQAPAAGSSEARVVLDGLAIPLDSGQRILLSGSTTAVLAGRTLEIIGRLAADEGAIVLDRNRRHQARGDSRGPASSDPAIRKIGITAPADGPSPAALRLFTVDTDVGIDFGRNFRVSGAGLQAGLSGAIRLRGRSPGLPRASGAVDFVDGSYRVDGRALRISRGRIVYDGDLADPAVDLAAVGDSPRAAAGSADSRSLTADFGPPLSAGLLAVCEQSLRGVWNILKLQYEITDRLSLSVRAGSERAMDLLWFFPFD